MVKVCEIRKIKYYRNACIIQNKWKSYLEIKIKAANNIIQCWNTFKYKKNITTIFLSIFKLKCLGNYTKKIQKIWRLKNIKIRTKNENCPISLLSLREIKWEQKILLEYEGIIYGFFVDDLFSYYINGSYTICPFTRRQLRYYEIFNLLKKKFNFDTDKMVIEDTLLIVTNFLLTIENVINKQDEIDNTIAILNEELENCIFSIFKYLSIEIWNSQKQMIVNRIFLKTMLTAYRYNIFNPYTKKNIPLTLKNDIVQKLDLYFRNYSHIYYIDLIEDNVSELIKTTFKSVITEAFNYCEAIINKKNTKGIDNIMKIIIQEIIM